MLYRELADNRDLVAFIAFERYLWRRYETMKTTHYEPRVPTQDDCRIARESSKTLSRYASRGISVRVSDTDDVVELPKTAVQLLVDILANMAEGNAITLLPVHAELTTKQAADLLGVSRPYLIRLLEDRRIPYHMVGTHRRVYFGDLQDYKKTIHMQREKALDDLAAEGQELNMGY